MGGVQGKAMGGVGALQRSWKAWLQKNWDVLPNTPAAWTNLSGKNILFGQMYPNHFEIIAYIYVCVCECGRFATQLCNLGNPNEMGWLGGWLARLDS